MNRRQTTILTHIASWLALMLVPMMTMGHGDGLTPRHVLMSTGVTLSFMLVFYANFLWIAPHYYSKEKRLHRLLLNVVLIVSVAVLLHLWIENMCNVIYPPKHHAPAGDGLHVQFVLRDIVNLSIVATVATALHLASRWRKTEEARLEAEAARTDAELRTLRHQINPHFLLNTLNNIYALTAIDAGRAQDAIQQLSKMLRHLLYDYEQPTVDMKDEVEFLENYAKLMRIRLPDSVEVDCRFNISHPEQQVAPMLFIPLLENAFKHGISPTSPSFIHLLLTADEHTITCDISNSNHPKNETDHSGHGIGLQQVQRRLDLAYADKYTWERGVSDDGKTYHSCITLNC